MVALTVYPISRLQAAVGESHYSPLVIYNHCDFKVLFFSNFSFIFNTVGDHLDEINTDHTGSQNSDKRDFQFLGRLEQLSTSNIFVSPHFLAPSFLLFQNLFSLSLFCKPQNVVKKNVAFIKNEKLQVFPPHE